jgi:hypothetical protein
MRLGKPAQPVHEPLGCEIRRRAYRQYARVLAAQQSLRAVGNPVERIPYGGEIAATGLRDDKALTLAIEQLQPKLGLERLDLMTHGALGDAKLVCCSREALMACRGLEGLQGVQRRQPARHARTIA